MLILITVFLGFGIFGLLLRLAANFIKRTAKKYPSSDPSHKLAGVGGWLLFFITKMILLAPLFEAGAINRDIIAAESENPDLGMLTEWATYKTFSWSMFALSSLINILAGQFMIWNRTRSAVRRAIVALWLSGPISVTLSIIGTQAILGASAIDDYAFVKIMFVAISSSAIWTGYLLLSRRVKATYGS